MIRIAAVLLMSAAGASGQSWENLKEVAPETRLLVTEKGGPERKAVFRAWSPEALTVDLKGSESRLRREQIARVRDRSHPKRLRNVLLGAGIGTAVGLVLEYTLGTRLRNEGTTATVQAGLILVPALACAGVGAASPGYPTIYRAPR